MGKRHIPRIGLEYVPSDVFPKISKYIVNTNDVIISIVGTIGLISIIDEYFDNASQTENCAKLSGLDQVDALFLYYFLCSDEGQMEIKMGTIGAVQAKLPLYNIEKINVYWPKREIRERIVAQLSNIDVKIELNTQINQTLEQIAQALFKSWFVDFDPVKAKIAVLEAGGTAEAAELAAMGTIAAKSPEQLADMQQSQPEAYQQLTQTAALFPAAMEDSKLGEIPEGWVVTKISDFGSIICGKTPSKARSDFFGRDIPFIKIPDMHTSMFVVNASEYLSKAGAESQPKKDIPKGSICISSIATVGKVIITIERSQTNQQINSIVPDKSFHTPYLYFYMVLLENHFHDLSSGGSATLNMNTSTFARVNVVKPPDDILLRFHTAVKNNLYLIEKYLLSNLTLEDTRDTLLPKLLSGAIDLAHINKSSPNSL